MSENRLVRPLSEAARTGVDKIVNTDRSGAGGSFHPERPVLVLLAAGKGTRFGQAPKCAQPVLDLPLARHSINAFQSFSTSPVVCIVGYRHEEVIRLLGSDLLYIRSDNTTGGTAFAAFEALSVPELLDVNPVLIISMGDRVVTSSVFQRLFETHVLGQREADLTLLTAIYEPPKHQGKGRVVRNGDRKVVRIIEQSDIDSIADTAERSGLDNTVEGNCPLYAIRARTLHDRLSELTNDNVQRQYYFTDVVERLSRGHGDIRALTTTVAESEYDLLCADVTRPLDLAQLEGILALSRTGAPSSESGLDESARAILADRPTGQVASIAAQLEELVKTIASEKLDFSADRPVGIGISGGRVRIAFMHPDMGRFFGPAWQMPIGARDESGAEQIVVLVQGSDDGQIHLFPTDPRFREKLNSVRADDECMYPGDEVTDWTSYEGFGTRMAESVLLSLGYFTDEELRARRQKNQPLPPPSLWIGNSMRRPFSLISNAIASMRTLRAGNLGANVRTYLGRDGFRGLRVVSTGSVPQGGFSSSSAVTVAVKNAINSLYDLGIPPDMLVHLACQAEYGTGVRAGALDQATEQKGKLGLGTLISSNPRDNYRILGTHPVPADRFHVLFAYSVDRDQEAWRWSAGRYAPSPEPGRLTASEMRKMTGKAPELAAILTRLPLDVDFFQCIEADLLQNGALQPERIDWMRELLGQVPMRITQGALRERLCANRQWYVEQLMDVRKLSAASASEKADGTFDALLADWRDPLLSRTDISGEVVEEAGVPLRAVLGYLFGETAKNFHLIFHTDQWIECVTRSQWGDRCLDIEPKSLPSRGEMMGAMAWEKGAAGPGLMDQWLARYGATLFDYNRGLDDQSLALPDSPPPHRMEGTNFFRGLALIDLAEAMLKRSFGEDAVAVRINAAGQGDYFQVHVDTAKVEVSDVRRFLEIALFQRFGLTSEQPFVQPHPGGGAVGARLPRCDQLPELVRRLRSLLG